MFHFFARSTINNVTVPIGPRSNIRNLQIVIILISVESDFGLRP
jgi:hypothetical protein